MKNCDSQGSETKVMCVYLIDGRSVLKQQPNLVHIAFFRRSEKSIFMMIINTLNNSGKYQQQK